MSQVGVCKNLQGKMLLQPHNSNVLTVGVLANGYHCLGHCLRSNMFPGCPVLWKSVSRESYVAHPLTPPDLWFGHKTDDLVQWAEMNIMNNKRSLTAVGESGKKV